MPLPPLIRDPDSFQAAIWDLLQVGMLVYISVALPLRACFNIDVAIGSIAFFIEICIDLAFIIDLVLNFRTAFIDDRGILEERPRKIAQHYLKGWFLPDLVSCFPFEYIGVLFGNRGAKTLRLIRLGEMLRLTRLKRVIGNHVGGRYGLVSELATFGILFGLIFFLAHLLACLWYVVGMDLARGSLVGGTSYSSTGWVQLEYCCVEGELPPCTGVCS